MPTAPFEIRPLSPAIGAEILGLDLRRALEQEELIEAVQWAFLDHHVLVFREQELDRETHKAFGRRFGSLHVHPSQRGDDYDGDPEIFVVRADERTRLNNGGLWHADVTCDAVPPLGSALILTDGPPVGGDTLFANMHMAYEELSEPIQGLLDGLWAVHDQRHDLANYGYEPRPGVVYPRNRHPVVVDHPRTGRPLLYVNRAFTTHIEGLSARESEGLLTLLFDHIADPRFQCRVRWETGTLTLWDNRCTQHYAVWDYWPQRRRGERVTIAGTAAPSRRTRP